jgi:isopenicillin N synthase-like dioxygenase
VPHQGLSGHHLCGPVWAAVPAWHRHQCLAWTWQRQSRWLQKQCDTPAKAPASFMVRCALTWDGLRQTHGSAQAAQMRGLEELLRSLQPAPVVTRAPSPAAEASAASPPSLRAVINHGVPAELVASTFEQQRALFGLPLEDKMRLLQNENNRGYTPFRVRRDVACAPALLVARTAASCMGRARCRAAAQERSACRGPRVSRPQEETLDPGRQRHGDTKEGFYIGREVPAHSPEVRPLAPAAASRPWTTPLPQPAPPPPLQLPLTSTPPPPALAQAAKPLHGPNVWPKPALLPAYREVTWAYFSALAALGMRWVGKRMRMQRRAPPRAPPQHSPPLPHQAPAAACAVALAAPGLFRLEVRKGATRSARTHTSQGQCSTRAAGPRPRPSPRPLPSASRTPCWRCGRCTTPPSCRTRARACSGQVRRRRAAQLRGGRCPPRARLAARPHAHHNDPLPATLLWPFSSLRNPSCPSVVRHGPLWPLPVAATSAGAHSDYGMLTLLATDDVPGLQARLGRCGRGAALPQRRLTCANAPVRRRSGCPRSRPAAAAMTPHPAPARAAGTTCRRCRTLSSSTWATRWSDGPTAATAPRCTVSSIPAAASATASRSSSSPPSTPWWRCVAAGRPSGRGKGRWLLGASAQCPFRYAAHPPAPGRRPVGAALGHRHRRHRRWPVRRGTLEAPGC